MQQIGRGGSPQAEAARRRRRRRRRGGGAPGGPAADRSPSPWLRAVGAGGVVIQGSGSGSRCGGGCSGELIACSVSLSSLFIGVAPRRTGPSRAGAAGQARMSIGDEDHTSPYPLEAFACTF